MTSQSPATTVYSYDARNRVKTASTGSATTTFDYYLDGKKKTVTYPNTAKEEYEYYQTNRVKTLTSSINGSPLSKFDYSYDANGNRLTQDESRLWGNGTGTVRQSQSLYSYDSLDRMTSYSITENSATTKTDYTFEGYNRKTETTTKPGNTAVTKTYTYDETDWLTQINSSTVSGTGTSATSQSLGYDNNGNTISKTDSSDPANPTTYAYDSRDKLISASRGGTNLGHYSYNASGYRIRQLNSDRGDLDYYYDGTAVIEERNAGGLLAHYRYAGKLYSLTDGTSNQYYHQDALGSTTDLTDDTGATKASYFLNPWGMIVDSIGSSVNRRVFTGKEIDQNTGLIYFGARYYDADTARFTTQDTYLGKQDEPPSLHRYLYAYSNPTVYVDLEGYEAEEGQKSLWGRFKGWVDKKKDQTIKWVGGQTEGLNNRFRGNYQANIHRKLAEAEGSDPDAAEAASRQHTAEIARDSRRQAEEIARPMVDGVELAAETAAGAGAIKGVGFFAGIATKAKNLKPLLSVEDKVGKVVTKLKNIFKEEKAVSQEVHVVPRADIDVRVVERTVTGKTVTREGRLKQLKDDPKVSSADRGWIENEMRQVNTGNRDVVRNPPGKDLRHPPGRANAQGFDYSETQIQDRATHRSQHRYLVERSTGTTIRIPKNPPKPGPHLPE